jgi:hypothetical protein
MRILFDVPEHPGYMPGAEVGSSPLPVAPKRIPRFPIVIIDDLPLYIETPPTILLGQPPSLISHVNFYHDHAKVRAKPLHPTNKPTQIYLKYIKEYAGLYADSKEDDAAISSVKSQLQRLLKTVYRGDIDKRALPRPIQWDAKRNMYTFLDGTILPETSDKEDKTRR